MLTSVLTAAVAYISTNIDDIFVLMILLAQPSKAEKGKIAAGHFLGVGLVTAISMLGAFGLQSLPLKFVGLLGFVPIFLGVKSWFDGKKEEDAEIQIQGISLLGMAMITLGNGADNIGVYIPLFTGFSDMERLGAMAVFTGMTALWLFLAGRLAAFQGVQALVDKYRHILIPVILIGLGVFIILDSGLL